MATEYIAAADRIPRTHRAGSPTLFAMAPVSAPPHIRKAGS